MPTVAILIPCYNSANYLPDLFEGIRQQTIPFDEIICYDDGSDDETAEVARDLGAITIIGEENRGPAFARNRMLDICKSTYVHFHDSDDLIDSRFVEMMLSSKTNESEQLLCNTYVLNRNMRTENLGNIVFNKLNETEDQLLFFLQNTAFASMGLYQRSALQSIGGFLEKLKGNEDPDLHVRLAENGFKFKAVNDFLVTKLEHAESFSHQNWMQCAIDKFSCITDYSLRLEDKYKPILALQAAELSNYFYREDNKSMSVAARSLAFQLKLSKINTSKFSRLVSMIFGLRFYLWLYRLRVDLKLI